MARVEINEIIWRPSETFVQTFAGASVRVENLDGDLVTVWDSPTGGNEIDNPIEADAYGRVDGPAATGVFVEGGIYNLVVSHAGFDDYTQRIDLVSGIGDEAKFAVIAEAPLNVEYPEYGADADVADNSAAIQAAIDDLPQGSITTGRGGEVLFPRLYRCASQLSFPDAFGVSFRGLGSGISDPLEPPRSGVVFTGSGSGSFIDARSNQGFKAEGMAILYDHASYAGDLVDFKHSTLAGDTTKATLRDVLLGGRGSLSINGARSLVSLRHSISCLIDNCYLAQAQAGIRGREESGGSVFYSNAHNIRSSLFLRLEDAVVNPGERWTIDGNTFEGLAQGLTPQHALYSDLVTANQITNGLTFSNNWLGDAFSGIPNYWLDFGTTIPRGITLIANQFNNDKKCVLFANGSGRNLVFIANQFGDHATTLVELGAGQSHFGVVFIGNDLKGCAGAEPIKSLANCQQAVVLGNAANSNQREGLLDLRGHLITGGATPTAAAQAAAGSGATTNIFGNDTSFEVWVTTGTSTTAGNQIVVTFANAYDASIYGGYGGLRPQLTELNAATKAAGAYVAAVGATTLTIAFANDPPDSTLHAFSVLVAQ